MCNWSMQRRHGWGQKKIVEEIMAEIFPNLIKTINPQVQDAQ